MIQCSLCSGWWHPQCGYVSPEVYEQHRTETDLEWTCPCCSSPPEGREEGEEGEEEEEEGERAGRRRKPAKVFFQSDIQREREVTIPGRGSLGEYWEITPAGGGGRSSRTATRGRNSRSRRQQSCPTREHPARVLTRDQGGAREGGEGSGVGEGGGVGGEGKGSKRDLGRTRKEGEGVTTPIHRGAPHRMDQHRQSTCPGRM